MGSSRVVDRGVERKAFLLGKHIAGRGAVLVTGATTGLPLAAARGAKEAGGEVIGFSPAINLKEHRKLHLPTECHDLIIFSGLSFKGRNLLNVRASSALVFIGGSMGALNEFTIAYDEEKLIGIVEGSGGFCNHLRRWLPSLEKPGNRSIIRYSSDPAKLVAMLMAELAEGRP